MKGLRVAPDGDATTITLPGFFCEVRADASSPLASTSASLREANPGGRLTKAAARVFATGGAVMMKDGDEGDFTLASCARRGPNSSPVTILSSS
jgi:hypothetical protein